MSVLYLICDLAPQPAWGDAKVGWWVLVNHKARARFVEVRGWGPSKRASVEEVFLSWVSCHPSHMPRSGYQRLAASKARGLALYLLYIRNTSLPRVPLVSMPAVRFSSWSPRFAVSTRKRSAEDGVVFTFTASDGTWEFSRLSKFHHDNGKERPDLGGNGAHIG